MAAPVTVGMLHPGEMGAALGAQLRHAGHRILWSSDGRGPASIARSHEAGLEDAGSLRALVEASAIVFSVIPPAAAIDVARSIGAFGGVFVDANAVAPTTTRAIARVIEDAGGRYVDAGIIGPPPRRRGDARLYLSGQDAATIAALFDKTAVDARVVSEQIGDASALKMAYAGFSKGSLALLLTMWAFAEREGVADALQAEWSESQPDLEARLSIAESARETKGWRWVGEMDEIASALRTSGGPDGFHRAAAEVYDGAPRPQSVPRQP